MRGWRTHAGRKAGEFEYCQNQQCDKEHFISSFAGSRPAENSWEGVKHGHK